MVFIFTNVYKYSNDNLFLADLQQLGLTDSDTVVFLNSCVPYFHAQEFFNQFNVVTINRRQGWKNAWFEYDRALSISAPRIVRFRLDDEGKIIDTSGKQIDRIRFSDYPPRKVPTTGWFAYRYMTEKHKAEQIIPVNYFGMQDGSTKKFTGHNWVYEDEFFKRVPAKKYLQQKDFVSEYKYLTPDPYKKKRLPDGRVVAVRLNAPAASK